MKRSILTAAIVVAMAALTAGQANAATSTNSSFQVTLNIQGSCSIQSATDMAFGAQTALGSNLDVSSSIGVQCTNSTPYTISLSAGGGTGATIASRILTNAGGGTIGYGIFRDSNRTQVWGSTAAVDTQGGTGNGSVQTYTAYGRVAPVVTPAIGSYSDTVAVTVTY